MTVSYISGSIRVFRGGSWFLDPQYARVASRYGSAPDFRGNGDFLGLRLMRRCL